MRDKILPLFLFAILVAAALFLAREWEPGTTAYASRVANPANLAPKALDTPRIDSVEPLMSNVRHILTRTTPRSQVAGYSIKGGEKILWFMPGDTDPLVKEAFLKGFKEKNCTVDIITVDAQGRESSQGFRISSQRSFDAPSIERRLRRSGLFRQAGWMRMAAKEYDRVVGAEFTSDDPEDPIIRTGLEFQWDTREQLSSPAVKFPYHDLYNTIDRKVWEIIRQAKDVHVTDAQGTDLKFTWFPEHWMMVEGSYPGMPRSPGFINHMFGPGSSENPIIPGHIMAYPRGGELPEANAEGVVVASIGQDGPRPLPENIRLHYKGSEIQRIEGGGYFGPTWEKLLKETDDIKYPNYPRPGTRWLTEISIGTNPKISGPVNIPELVNDPRYGRHVYSMWTFARDRSGVIHVGHGTRSSQWWAQARDLPVYHIHVWIYFNTYKVQTRDGRDVTLLDNGHLTTLDDPEVRQIASKYGSPDEILREDWVPALNDKNQLELPKSKFVSWQEFIQTVPASLR